MILIFLDIDGVLLPFPDAEQSTCGAIFPDSCLEALSTILSEFPASRLILSSTWRAQATMINDILDSIQTYGHAHQSQFLRDLSQFHDMADPSYHDERQYEIYKYLQDNNLLHQSNCKWIALDDEELLEGKVNAQWRQAFEGHVVKVNSRIGLTKRDAHLAVQLIREQMSTVNEK